MTSDVMTTRVEQPPAAATTGSGFRSDGAGDRLMRRMLGIPASPQQSGSSSTAGAHRAFRISVVVSAVRCLITYVLVPVLVPILSLSGWVAAPIGLALCVFAVVNGIISVRRFWRVDHPQRWMYTGFIAVVFVIHAVALVSDLARLGVMA